MIVCVGVLSVHVIVCVLFVKECMHECECVCTHACALWIVCWVNGFTCMSVLYTGVYRQVCASDRVLGWYVICTVCVSVCDYVL